MYKKNPNKPSSGKINDFQENFTLGGCILVLCTHGKRWDVYLLLYTLPKSMPMSLQASCSSAVGKANTKHVKQAKLNSEMTIRNLMFYIGNIIV